MVYNYYNLDPEWETDQDVQRIFLIEPSIFEKYPVSQKCLDFALALSKNIPNCQLFIGEFRDLKEKLGTAEIVYKEHPLNKNYQGTEASRDWLSSVTGYHRSFFSFWKQCKKRAHLVKQKINIVWLKRDLRTQDHHPLQQAENSSLDYLCIYIFDPKKMNQSDSSLRHHQFVYHSILDVNKTLKRYNRKVLIFHQESLNVFQYLSEHFSVKNVFSYQESGTRTSWNIDKTVETHFKQHNIEWKQFQRDGIIRGIQDRKMWDQKWYETVYHPIIKNSFSNSKKLRNYIPHIQ